MAVVVWEGATVEHTHAADASNRPAASAVHHACFDGARCVLWLMICGHARLGPSNG